LITRETPEFEGVFAVLKEKWKMGRRISDWLRRVSGKLLGRDLLNRRDALWGYIFCIPWIIGFIGLTIGPFAVSAYMSFFQWKGYGTPNFVGFQNYVRMLTEDRFFWHALSVTFRYAAGAVPLTIVLAFFLAWMLSKNRKGVETYRAIFYLPSVITGAASAFIWLFVFNPRSPLSNFLEIVTGSDDGWEWLSTPELVVPAFVIMQVWTLGTMMLIFLGGLKNISPTYYEVARVDGAGPIRQLWHITLPLISPSLLYVFIFSTVQALQELTAPLIIFTTGSNAGPLNAGLFYTVYLYQSAFLDARMGYASALAWVLFGILLVLTLFYFVVFGRRVYYGE